VTLEEKITMFKNHGWCPVKWAHHPTWVKDIIREGHFRPKMKGCFENCGRFMMAAVGSDREKDLRYHEGWAVPEKTGIPIVHAWLTYKGEVLDLTLTETTQYLESKSYTTKGFIQEVFKSSTYGPFTNLWAMGPYAEAFQKLSKRG
jgi:hypothetical protein